jgi:hypothetical protein
MVDINVDTATWPSPTQYAQNIINPESAGTTFVLKAGVHRMQKLTMRAGDTIEFEDGAILRGSEDISGGWTTVGNGTWYKVLSNSPSLISAFGITGNGRDGYQNGRLMWPIVDGEPLAYRILNDLTSFPTCAWWDSGNSRLYINVDPTGASVEIARQGTAAINGNVSDVTIKAQGDTFRAVVENYASDAQSGRAAIRVGLSDNVNDPITESGTIVRNIELRACQGTAIGLAQAGLYSGMYIHRIGQQGVGSSKSHDWIFEYNRVGPFNCIAGWKSGWEGGNTKFTRAEDTTDRGNYYVNDDHDNISATGTLWYDIDNIRNDIYANLVWDKSVSGVDRRGIFFEISDGCKIHDNIVIGCARVAENDGWSRAIICSDSYGTVGTPIEIYRNHIYDCAGGVGGVSNNRSHSGVRWLDVWGNITHYDTSAPWTEKCGITRWDSAAVDNNAFHKNVYYVPSASDTRWRDQSTDNNIGTVNFATWQSSGGHDLAGDTVLVGGSHPLTDPDPLDGGMALG